MDRRWLCVRQLWPTHMQVMTSSWQTESTSGFFISQFVSLDVAPFLFPFDQMSLTEDSLKVQIGYQAPGCHELSLAKASATLATRLRLF